MAMATARGQLVLGLATMVSVALVGQHIAQAAGVVGTGTPASCTDAALNTALTGGGLVTFDCGVGAVSIDISPGAGGTGTKTISSDTTIDGGGVITISGGHSVRVFSVNIGVTFTVQNLTIANGNSASGDGGGIYNGGTLMVTNSTFSGNSAANTGGGISNNGIGTVTNSTFSGNGARSGGGIFNNYSYGGMLTVTNATFSGNSVGNDGGGIYNGGTLTITTSTFSGNSANNGGGIWSGSTYTDGLTVTNGTFAGNSASGSGGGIFNYYFALTVINSTYAGNSAGKDGGGIHTTGIWSNGTVTVTNSTFAGNSASGNGGGIGTGVIYSGGTLTITNTIVGKSTSGGNCLGGVTDGGHNIDDGTSCGFSTANGSLNSTDPKLDPAGLKSNGGPTQTIALCTGSGTPASCAGASPAIDAGDDAVTGPPDNLITDQRGLPRKWGAHVDIGAFEVQQRGTAAPAISLAALLALAVLLSAAGWLRLQPSHPMAFVRRDPPRPVRKP